MKEKLLNDNFVGDALYDSLREQHKNAKTSYESSSCLSSMFFSWVYPTIQKMQLSKEFTLDNLEQLPAVFRAENCYKRF
jgi:hypothetical protein